MTVLAENLKDDVKAMQKMRDINSAAAARAREATKAVQGELDAHLAWAQTERAGNINLHAKLKASQTNLVPLQSQLLDPNFNTNAPNSKPNPNPGGRSRSTS